jgi:hypothetical protein
MIYELFPYIAQPKPKEMSDKNTSPSIFSKDNYMWMLAGLIVMAIGMFLLAGGKSTDPNVFDKNTVYSTTRITVAPILILAGLVIEILAIFRKPKVNEG